MQGLILAGGEGTRLRPLTSTVPKSIVPLANRPFVSYMIDWLAGHGIDDIVVSCGFMAAEVRSVLGKGEREGPRLRYVEEESPLGTAGAVKLAEPLLDERFAVLNGDILADFDLTALQQFHAERRARATIALMPVDDPSAYGLVRTRDDGSIGEFVEKPEPEQIDTDLVNAGAYVLERDVLDSIAPERAVSFEREVFPALIGQGLHGLPVEGYWLDIGTPERYLRATRDILEGTVSTVVSEGLGEEQLSVGPETEVAPEAVVSGPAMLGGGCSIAAGARVGPLAVLGDGCSVAEGARIEQAVLHAGVQVDQNAIIRESIVAAGARVGAGSRVEGAVVGEAAVVG